MATDCALNNIHTESESNRQELEFLSLVKERVNAIMGIDKIVTGKMKDDPVSQEALKQWVITKENLISHIVKHARASNYSVFTLDSYLRSLENSLQQDVGIPIDSKSAWQSGNPRRFLAMAKAINRLIHLQNTRWGKKLNIWERAFLPVRMFAWRIDPIGNISRYIEDVTSILENSRNSSAKYKDQYNNIMSDYRGNVFNAVNNLQLITKDHVLGGVDTTDTNGMPITFLGSEESDGIIKHRVRYESGVELVDEDVVSVKRVKDALVDKYTYELTNDLMHGQARYIRWKNEPSVEHKKRIKEILNDLKMKIDANDEADLVSGLPDIHSMELPGGITVNYVILKDLGPEGFIPQTETYSAYIINHKSRNQSINYYSDRLTKSNREKFLDVTTIPQMREGFYKAEKYRTYGKRIMLNTTTSERFIPTDERYTSRYRGWDFSNLSGKSLNVSQEIAGAVTVFKGRSADRSNRSSLFYTIASLRKMYSQIGDDIKKASESEFAKINDWLKPNGRAQQVLYPIIGSKDAKGFLEDLKKMFVVQNRIWIDKNGGVHTPNSHFLKLKDNYAPILFDDVTRDAMLDDFIDNLSTEIEAGNRSEDKLEMLNGFMLTRARLDNNQPLIDELEEALNVGYQEDTNTILAQRNVYAKNRTEWTDPALRRKDSLVHGEYVDRIFNNIHRNKLMITMLEALEQLASVGRKQFDLEAAKWVVNRAKIAYGDPMSWAGIGSVDFSYHKVAKYLNKLPGNRNWDAESAQKLINTTRGFFAATLLGATGAMVNRTQIVNEAIKYGWNAVVKSGKILAGKDADITQEQAFAIVNFLGIDEVTNMLVDFMTHGGEVDMSDAGIISTPFGSLPTFTLKDFAVIVASNRSGYIRKGTPETDKLLLMMEANRIKTSKDRLREIEKYLSGSKSLKNLPIKVTLQSLRKEQGRLKNNLERRKLEQLREAFADFILTDKKSNNSRILEARIRRLMGEVSENRLKRMVQWKLSFWYDGFAPELFTFTESEKFMRRQSAIIALLAAANMGQLGKFNPNIKANPTSGIPYVDKNGVEKTVRVPSIFLTDKAKQIARNNVNNSMFGMSSLHLGEAFNGFGSQLFMYKSYPLQQMIHDWKIVQSFIDSSVNVKEVPTRLMKALTQAHARYKAGTKYTEVMNSSNIDHQALMALRFIGSRIGMTVFSVAAESLAIFRPFLRSPMYREFSTMVRGGENPLFGVMFRLAVNGLLWASMDEDDWFEGSLVEVGWDFARLFFPVFLTMPLYAASELFE